MIVVDTSVVVAAFASWHEAHASAVKTLNRRPRLPTQVALETYSVLTRLPPPHRATPKLVHEFLRANLGEQMLDLPPARVSDLLSELADADIVGGAAYDGLIGAIAREAGATLLTLDRRARQTYQRLSVRFELLDYP